MPSGTESGGKRFQDERKVLARRPHTPAGIGLEAPSKINKWQRHWQSSLQAKSFFGSDSFAEDDRAELEC